VLVRIDRLIYRAKFAAAQESAVGTFQTCPAEPPMSVDRGGADLMLGCVEFPV